MIRSSIRVLVALALALASASTVFAQNPSTSQGEDDAVLKLAEPDFTLISLPTSLRLPKFKSAFRVTHRFTRPLNCDTCADSLAGDAFGIDNGAQIGLEYRFGIVPNGEIGVHRTSDKTIELFGQYGLTRQGKSTPFETSALVAPVDVHLGSERRRERAFAGARRGSCGRSSATRPFTSSRSGSIIRTYSSRRSMPTTTRSWSASVRASESGRPSTSSAKWLRVCQAIGRASIMAASRSRSASAVTCSS